MANRQGKFETMSDFIFMHSKINVDVIVAMKLRLLLLGRVAMTNLDILKAEMLLCQQMSIESHLWLFQWSCESWTIKKAEH